MCLRTMTERDVPAGVRLNNLAGWNQTATDWHRFLKASPSGCFVADVDSRVCGTATTISYQDRFAWIGMVLVDPDYRRRGIGTQLLQKTLEYLDQRGIPTLKLDATPQGQPLYAKLGFVPEYQIERWILKRLRGTGTPAHNSCCVSLIESELLPVLAMDRELFGADRSFLLRSLLDDAPDFAMCISKHGRLHAYAFGRRGFFGDHLGPWIADSRSGAENLLHEFMARSARETLVVDCLPSNPMAIEMVRACGFAQSRILTRMYRGPNTHPGKSAVICAIVGPEFG
jgi:GNAT superfamily N-acetyltransferase